MKNKTKIKDLFNTDFVLSATDTIFDILKNSTNYPLLSDFITSDNYATLDSDYYLSNSGEKYISPIVQRLIDAYEEDAEHHTLQWFINTKLASILYARFGVKWKKLFTALNTEYAPLENYSMTETRTPNLTDSETQNAKTDITSNRTTNSTNKYNGFNNNEPVTVSVGDGTDDVTTSGASEDNEVTKTVQHQGSETLTRSGNIGVTTSQQMLESEFKVREFDFYKTIYKDIDSVLCLSIY